MKKTLVAIAVMGACAVAYAEPTVNMYGVMDTGFVKTSAASWRMGSNQDSRLGFYGFEDLGNGLKATFELERRFDLNDGTNGSNYTPVYYGRARNGDFQKDWEAVTNVGLMGSWGRFRIGRVADISTQTIRQFDPFEQNGVGSMIWSSIRSEAIDNTIRYDSPTWAGLNFAASYSLGKNTKSNGELSSDVQKTKYGKQVDNDGFALNAYYNNYGFMATANFERLADSNKGQLWNLGVGYKFGPAKVTLLYEQSKDKGFRPEVGTIPSTYLNLSSPLPYYVKNNRGNVMKFEEMEGIQSTQKNWLLGLEWDIGPGQLDASFQYAQMDDIKGTKGSVFYTDAALTKRVKDADIMKYAIGYTYNLSKRTALYGQVAYTDFDNNFAGQYYTGTTRDDMVGFQLGMTHKF